MVTIAQLMSVSAFDIAVFFLKLSFVPYGTFDQEFRKITDFFVPVQFILQNHVLLKEIRAFLSPRAVYIRGRSPYFSLQGVTIN